MATRRQEIPLRVLKNISRVIPPSNCFMMNLTLQKAAQRHFVFVECYVVSIHEKLIRACLHFSMSQQICIRY